MLAFAFSLAKSLLVFAAIMCFIAAAELAFSRETPPARSTVARYVLFGAVFILCGKLFTWAITRRIEAPAVDILWLIPLLLLTDLLYYWMHRAQHSIPWLWRFHAVHHSVEKMGPGAGYHHLTEIPIKAALVGIPMALVIGKVGWPVALVLISLHGGYLHSTTRLNFGWFAWIVADNRTHRIHHSLEPRHFDRNFGAYTLLWDKLFGTAYFPARNEWPEVGLEDRREPQSIAQYLHSPVKADDRSGEIVATLEKHRN